MAAIQLSCSLSSSTIWYPMSQPTPKYPTPACSRYHFQDLLPKNIFGRRSRTLPKNSDFRGFFFSKLWSGFVVSEPSRSGRCDWVPMILDFCLNRTRYHSARCHIYFITSWVNVEKFKKIKLLGLNFKLKDCAKIGKYQMSTGITFIEKYSLSTG